MAKAGFTVLLGVSILGLVPGEAGGLWARLSLEELTAQSELIVVGELVAIQSQPNLPNAIGTLSVEEVLAGPGEATEVLLVFPGAKKKPLSSTDLTYTVGQRGLWFLRRNPGAETPQYLADHPQRFQPVENAESVRAYLRSHQGP